MKIIIKELNSIHFIKNSFFFLFWCLVIFLNAEEFVFDSYFGTEYLPVKIENNQNYREKICFRFSDKRVINKIISTKMILRYAENELNKNVVFDTGLFIYDAPRYTISTGIFPVNIGLQSGIENSFVRNPRYKKSSIFDYNVTGINVLYKGNRYQLFGNFGGNNQNTFVSKVGVNYHSENIQNFNFYLFSSGRDQVFNDVENSLGMDLETKFHSLRYRNSTLLRLFLNHDKKNSNRDEVITFNECLYSVNYFTVGISYFLSQNLQDKNRDSKIASLLGIDFMRLTFHYVFSYSDFRKSFISQRMIRHMSNILYHINNNINIGFFGAYNCIDNAKDNYEIGVEIRSNISNF